MTAVGLVMKMISPVADIPKPCVFLTETSQLLRLTETDLWALLDEIQQWRASGHGQLSSAAEVFLASQHYSVKMRGNF